MQAALASALLLLCSAAQAARPRLIVLISVDTLRADRLRPDLTPRLTGFAREAVSFQAATAQATWTLPSHATMLTSLMPMAHGAGGTAGTSGQDWRAIADAAVGVAQVLHDAGWRTEAVVGSPVLDARWGFARGFDRYGRGPYGPRGDERVFDAAARAAARSDGKPLFLFVHSNMVHSYARVKPSAAQASACPLTEEDMLKDLAMRPAPAAPGSAACAVDRRAYDRAVACMDQAVGRFLDAVASSPGGRDALVIFTSDHGEALCEEHPRTPLRGHGHPGYPDQVDVPLLVRPPGGAAGGPRLASSARELDVAPTILDYAGLSAPKAFEGRSLKPAVDGRAQEDLPAAAQGEDWASLRRASLELVRRTGAPEELYDVRAPGRAGRDLAAKRAEDAAALGKELDALLSRLPRAPREAPRGVDARLDAALKAEGYRK